MRILSLDFDRYGSFTDRHLEFNPTSQLHVIYGRNAAGKSCALAGITDLFFGIEAQTRYAFLHETKTMRLGARLQSRNLATIEFRRRKGNKNVLSTLDGNPLDDAALFPFLGGITRSVFEHAFGLNSEQLRKGAEEMLESDGEVGASLYAAASGLSGITRLRRELDEEAARIFRPGRGSEKRRFDQAAYAFAKARTDVRKLTLRAESLTDLHSQIESLSDKLSSLNDTRDKDRAEHSRLTRLRTIAPQLRSLDIEQQRLQDLADLPDLSEQAIQRLREAITASEASEFKHKAAIEAFQRAEEELEKVAVDKTVLTHRMPVQEIETNIGKYLSAIHDKVRVTAEAEDKRQEIVQLAARVGLAEERLNEAQPTDAALAELDRLIKENAELARERKATEQSIKEATDKIDNLVDGRTTPPALDPAMWRARFNALAPGRALLDRSRILMRNCSLTRKRLQERALRLNPLVLDIEVLATISLPTKESIAGMANRFVYLANKEKQIEPQLASLISEIEEAQNNLESFVTGEQLATSGRIADARMKRGEIWRKLKTVLLGDESEIAVAARPATVELYEERILEADQLADVATRDADRIAQYNTECKSLENMQERLPELEKQEAARKVAFQQATSEWNALWTNVTSSPLTPSEMLSWIDATTLLLEQRDSLLVEEAELSSVQPKIAEFESAIKALAHELVLDEGSAVPCEDLYSLVEDKLSGMTEAWNAIAVNQGLLSDARKHLEKYEKGLTLLAVREAAWLDSWQKAVTLLQFDSVVSPAAVEAAVKVWRALPSQRKTYADAIKRVRGMERDISDFENEVTRLSQLISPDEPLLAPVEQARRLGAILDHQAGQQLLCISAEDKVEVTKAALQAAAQDAARDSKLVGARMSELQLLGEPALALERIERASAIRAGIKSARSILLAQSEGFSETQIRESLEGFDSASALTTIQELAQRFLAQDDEINEVFSRKSAALKALEEAEVGFGAEFANQQMKIAEAELESAGREYISLKLSSVMLGHVVEKHRNMQSAPLMESAEMLFRDLTDGMFTAIDQEFDPDDRPQIVAVRKTGETVNIDGLSDGQRDQLYLALRLAYLADYGRKSEPIPFIGDDIFTTFDETSTRAGLLALSALSANLQPILFTHHRFVADLAISALGDKVDLVEL